MKFAAILTDGTFIVVSADELDLLLRNKEAQLVMHSDVWVRLCFGTLRNLKGDKKFDGEHLGNIASLKKTRCNYCGKEFDTAGVNPIYSVIVENSGFPVHVVEGELIYGAYHFCSDICLFRREHGPISVEHMKKYNI